jgi:hypothetical protein
MKNKKNSSLPAKPQYEIQLWLESLLPSYDMISTKQLLDYTYIIPYNDDIGISININQLYNIQTTNKKSLFSAFSSPPPQTIYKAIYSISDGQGYQNQPIYDDMKFTEYIDINSPSKAPIFIDGFQRFYFKNGKNVKNLKNNEISRGLQNAKNENNENENVFLIVDIRSVTINTKTTPDEITVEPNIPGIYVYIYIYVYKNMYIFVCKQDSNIYFYLDISMFMHAYAYMHYYVQDVLIISTYIHR